MEIALEAGKGQAMPGSLELAYLGDAVYEVIIRSIVVERSNAPVNKLHKRSSTLVKASAQARLIKAIEARLTEEEVSVYKRGRNAKQTPSRHADRAEYHSATGFEALIGYLYYNGRSQRPRGAEYCLCQRAGGLYL